MCLFGDDALRVSRPYLQEGGAALACAWRRKSRRGSCNEALGMLTAAGTVCRGEVPGRACKGAGSGGVHDGAAVGLL